MLQSMEIHYTIKEKLWANLQDLGLSAGAFRIATIGACHAAF